MVYGVAQLNFEGNAMWSKNPAESKAAMEKVALALKHSDLAMVRKASSLLSEKGGTARDYMLEALKDESLSDAARVTIQTYYTMSG